MPGIMPVIPKKDLLLFFYDVIQNVDKYKSGREKSLFLAGYQRFSRGGAGVVSNIFSGYDDLFRASQESPRSDEQRRTQFVKDILAPRLTAYLRDYRTEIFGDISDLVDKHHGTFPYLALFVCCHLTKEISGIELLSFNSEAENRLNYSFIPNDTLIHAINDTLTPAVTDSSISIPLGSYYVDVYMNKPSRLKNFVYIFFELGCYLFIRYPKRQDATTAKKIAVVEELAKAILDEIQKFFDERSTDSTIVIAQYRELLSTCIKHIKTAQKINSESLRFYQREGILGKILARCVTYIENHWCFKTP